MFRASTFSRPVLLLALLACAAGPADADTIVEQTAATGTAPVPTVPGQSLLTPSGNPWSAITFNFFSDAALTPNAAGTLYLLTQEYTGTPAALSSATPGFLATSTGIQSGVYQFDPNFLLQPNTQYFFYSDSSLQFRFDTGGGAPVGRLYIAGNTASNFTPNTADDTAFRLSGTPIPEPGTCVLFGLGALGVLGARRRRRQQQDLTAAEDRPQPDA